MPGVHRRGDKSTGHDACAPTVLSTSSNNVFVNEKGCGTVGSVYSGHGCDDHSYHVYFLSSGSNTVFCNSLPAARIGDPVSCIGSAAEGSTNVFSG